MGKYANVKMWKCEDVEMWKCENREMGREIGNI